MDVNITSDSSVERNETVQCLLEFLKSDDYSDISLSLVPSEATITIEDLSDGMEREGGGWGRKGLSKVPSDGYETHRRAGAVHPHFSSLYIAGGPPLSYKSNG